MQQLPRGFAIETLAQLLFPLTPHLAEDMWHTLGHKTLLAQSPRPETDAALAETTKLKLVFRLMVNFVIPLNWNATVQMMWPESLGAGIDLCPKISEWQITKKSNCCPKQIINVVA